MKVNNLQQRTITGLVFASLVIGSILWNPYLQTVVFSVFMVLGLMEYYRLFKGQKEIQVSSEIGIFIGLFIFTLLVGISLKILPVISITFIVPLLFTLILVELWKKHEHPISNIALMVFGILYVVIPFYLTIDLNLRNTFYLPTVVGMFFLIWTNDTFAYVCGRLFGKHKLFERISPNKTWEGTIGGIVFTLALGFIIGKYINEGNTFFWVISAVIIAPGSIFGDLLESLFKRSLNIKDTGTILPGHGGILDRFDAALFSIPFFYCWNMVYYYWN
jgi:phosphatidate cytidylyltransferase